MNSRQSKLRALLLLVCCWAVRVYPLSSSLVSDLGQGVSQQEPADRASQIIAEVLRLTDAGRTVDPQRVIAKYPECAAELREFFRAQRVLEQFRPAPEPAQRATVSTSAADSVPNSGHGPEELPREFGRYRLQKVLGQGAMGAVYLAHDTQLDRQVALKTPKLDGDASAEVARRFQREARSAAALHHRNICPVFDVGEIDGITFLTMAFIDGFPLSALIDGPGTLSQKRTALQVGKIAQGLSEAHRHGVIHRDLKPANIMIDQSREPVVMDFGLARQLENNDHSRLTNVGTIMGSPAYMSPEQVSGDPDAVGPASDIYSLGVILFEMLTGRLPYEGSVVAILGQIISADTAPDCRHFQPDVDAGLADICQRMMAPQIQNRFSSMDRVVEALNDWRRQQRSVGELVRSDSDPAVIRGDGESPRVRTVADRRRAARRGHPATQWKWLAGGGLAFILLCVSLLVRHGTDDPPPSSSLPATDQVPPEVSAAETIRPGYVSLFNGKDLSGWRLEGRAAWTVENGELVGSRGGSRLVTVASKYHNCEVRVECRLSPKANSGVFLRTRYNGVKAPGDYGYQAQLCNQVSQSTLTGGIYHHTHFKEQLVRDNEWFELRFRAVGDRLTVFVNGQQTADTVTSTAGSGGSIALQSWDDQQVRFRAVEVCRLTPDGEPILSENTVSRSSGDGHE